MSVWALGLSYADSGLSVEGLEESELGGKVPEKVMIKWSDAGLPP